MSPVDNNTIFHGIYFIVHNYSIANVYVLYFLYEPVGHINNDLKFNEPIMCLNMIWWLMICPLGIL